MHVLIIPSWYQTKKDKISGIFFKEQAEAIAKKLEKVGMLIIREIPLYKIHEIISEKVFFFKAEEFNFNNVNCISIQYITIPKVKFVKKILNHIFSKIAFKKYLKLYGKPDLCHLHSYFKGDTAMFIKKNYGIPYVVTEHFSGFARKLLKKEDIDFSKNIYKNADRRISVSENFSKLLYNITGYNFIFIPNMIDCSFFSFDSNYKYKKNNEFIFLSIASLDINKNQNTLLEAFAEQFKNNKNIKLIIVGNGPLKNYLIDKSKQLNVEEQVIFFGSATREQVKLLYNSSDAFVLSSKYETFGVVLIEALSCGLPVIATKCGGPESIITNENVGELVAIDKEQIGKAMLKVYKNYQKYDREYIRKYAIDNFSNSVVVGKLIKIYEDVIS